MGYGGEEMESGGEEMESGGEEMESGGKGRRWELEGRVGDWRGG